ncbi:hypothetical protein ACOMHN_053476 [Nucella lapillus]
MDTTPLDSSSSTPGRQGNEDHSTVPPLPSPPESPFLSDGMSPAGPECLKTSPRDISELEQLSRGRSEIPRFLREMEADMAAWFAFDRQQRDEDTNPMTDSPVEELVLSATGYQWQKVETKKQRLEAAKFSRRMRHARQQRMDSLRLISTRLRGYRYETPCKNSLSRALQSHYSFGRETGGMGRQQRRTFCAMEELTMELSALQVQQSSVEIQEPRTAGAEMEQLQRRFDWITMATRGRAAAAQQEEVVQSFQHMDLRDPESQTEQ